MLTIVGRSHCIRACHLGLAACLWLALSVRPAVAQTAASPSSTFLVFMRSQPIGSEQVTVERTADGWTITGSGRMGAPIDLIGRNLEVRYDADWKPRELHVDATLRGISSTLHTTVSGTTAANEIKPLNGMPITRNDPVDAAALLVPSPFVAPYEALAARLRTATPGSALTIYQPPSSTIAVEVGVSTTEQIKTVNRVIEARRTAVTFRVQAMPPLEVVVWGDETGRLLRLSIPAQTLEYARDDVASVGARLVTLARTNDEDVRIPANGFSLAATVSKPTTSAGKLPAVLLVGGAGLSDRDETTFGVPIFAHLATAFADAGFLVVRYDRRGVGQSGGRPEAARLADFAEDLRAVVKTVGERKDVDRDRIALVGHGEGGWVAMMAASKNKRVKAVTLVGTAGVTGEELNLYQLRHGLERSGRSEEERGATLALQEQIHKAVITGTGWEAIKVTAPVRRQADTPYFQSFLTLDPAKVMRDLAQPILIVHGERDRQVPPTSAERLETLARARKNSPPVEVARVADVNHLLVTAETGEVDEYDRLPSRQVSPGVTAPIVAWLQRTLRAVR